MKILREVIKKAKKKPGKRDLTRLKREDTMNQDCLLVL